jgi:hypothetical protein
MNRRQRIEFRPIRQHFIESRPPNRKGSWRAAENASRRRVGQPKQAESAAATTLIPEPKTEQ